MSSARCALAANVVCKYIAILNSQMVLLNYVLKYLFLYLLTAFYVLYFVISAQFHYGSLLFFEFITFARLSAFVLMPNYPYECSCSSLIIEKRTELFLQPGSLMLQLTCNFLSAVLAKRTLSLEDTFCVMEHV
jgi:hypothetical protein